MRQRVIQALRGLDPISVENPVHPGTPDVNHTGGWIELKAIEAWPVRPTTPLRIPHFTPEQRVWLTRRWRADRRAWLFILVANDWLLFEGETGARIVGHTPRADLLTHAIARWTPMLVDEQLRAAVSPKN